MNNLQKIGLGILCFLQVITCIGQSKFEPRILVLSPTIVKYDTVFEKEVSKINAEINERLGKKDNEEVPEDTIGNMKIMMTDGGNYAKILDFKNEISFISQSCLIYGFYENFPGVLISLKDIKSNGIISDLKKISREENMQYVLNFPMLNFFKESGVSFSNIRVQLYSLSLDSLLIDSLYIGNWNNPGFEFACSDSSLYCTISNVLAQAIPDVINIVTNNSPQIIQQKELARQRYLELMEDYYPRLYDKVFLSKIILPTDSNINLSSLYQCITDSGRTKFVAFFLEQSSATNFQKLTSNKKENNVNIISNLNIKDSGFLNDVPETYAYIVKGLKYKDKWYYQKSNVTYFNSNSSEQGRKEYFNNLQGWDFFKNNSTQFNPDFWEGRTFPKIVDKRKDPDWDKYGTTIWKEEEEENRDYIGKYEMVADVLKNQKEEEVKAFNTTVAGYFKQFYEGLKKHDAINFASYNLMNDEFELIYPKSQEYILNMIQIVNNKGEKTIRYFLLFKKSGQILEWTYFTMHPFDEKTIKDRILHYGTIGMAELNTLTEWDFSYKTLDNDDFWEKYVLTKSDDKYTYLKEVK